MSETTESMQPEDPSTEVERVNVREQAILRFPRNEDESEEAYSQRIDKIAVVLPNMWQKGQSGNPAGGKKKFTSFKSAIEDALTEGVQVIWKDGEIRNVSKVTRQDLFMKNVVDMLVYGKVNFPGYKNRKLERRDGISEENGRSVSLGGKDWADYALKFMRYAAPPAPPDRTKEVSQVIFDLGTFLPKEVKRTIIKLKTGDDSITYDEPEIIDTDLIEDDGSEE